MGFVRLKRNTDGMVQRLSADTLKGNGRGTGKGAGRKKGGRKGDC